MVMNMKIKLLSKDYIDYSLKEEYKKCEPTGFALIMGCNNYDNMDYDYNPNSWYWLEDTLNLYKWQYQDGNYLVSENGTVQHFTFDLITGGIRPCFDLEDLPKEYFEQINNSDSRFVEIEFGEYPKTIIRDKESQKLEHEYSNFNYTRTGNVYTTNDIYASKKQVYDFLPKEHNEYIVDGEKYIRIVANPIDDLEWFPIYYKPKRGKINWIKVEPITWVVDKRNQIVFTKEIILSGMCPRNTVIIDNTLYIKNTVQHFLNNSFKEEMLYSYNLAKSKKIEPQKRLVLKPKKDKQFTVQSK